MKKQNVKKSLIVKKSSIAKLSDKETNALQGGSTFLTSAIPQMCLSIVRYECGTSAWCPAY